MQKGTRLSLHYITNEPSKLFSFIRGREKWAIEEYAKDVKTRNDLKEANTEFSKRWLSTMNPIPETFEEGYEMTVVKDWEGVFSTYPIMKTDWQWHYSTVVKFNDRPKHIAQKYVALRVCEYEDSLSCQLWKEGAFLKNVRVNPVNGEVFGTQNISIGEYSQGELMEELLKYLPDFVNVEVLSNIPLLLPINWKDLWPIKKQSKLMYYC